MSTLSQKLSLVAGAVAIASAAGLLLVRVSSAEPAMAGGPIARSAEKNSVPGYAIAHIDAVDMGPSIVAYLERIDATLAPFGGRYIIHGGDAQVLEGKWSGDLVIIAFPDLDRAKAWYNSPGYQAIRRLRTENSRGDVFLASGVPLSHRATDILKAGK